MDSSSEPDDNAGNLALQEREATIKQLLGMLQMLGASSPLDALKSAGLAGAFLGEGKAKDPLALSHGDRLVQNTAKLKQLADQQRKLRKQANELEDIIKSKIGLV